MRLKGGQIRIGAKGEAAINREFVEAWRRAQKGTLQEPEVHLLLLKAGLVEKDARNRVTVPWDKIQTEIDLAA